MINIGTGEVYGEISTHKVLQFELHTWSQEEADFLLTATKDLSREVWSKATISKYVFSYLPPNELNNMQLLNHFMYTAALLGEA